MRVHGAIKSILHGVTRNNLVNAESVYFKDQVNTIPRVDEGLNKRPPAELVASMGDALAAGDTEFVKDFIINDVAYFLVVRASAPKLMVYREDGTEYTVTDGSDTTYLDGITEDDMELTVKGESIYILNKTKTVSMEQNNETYLSHSLFHITGPVEYGTQIWVTCKTDGGVPTTFTYTVPTSPIAVQGADAVAGQLAALIHADANFTAYNRGATVIVRTPLNNNTEITISTTIGEEMFRVMNGVVDTVDDLPRYAYDRCITEVRAITDDSKGSFYMEAEAEASYDQDTGIPPVWPAPTVDNINPEWYSRQSGVYVYEGATPNPAYENSLRDYSITAIDGATVDYIELQHVAVGESPTTSDRYLAIWFNVGQTPSGSAFPLVRFAVDGTPNFTIHEEYLEKLYGSTTNQWFYKTQSGFVAERTFQAGTLYDLWVDPTVTGGSTKTYPVEVRWIETAKPGIQLQFNNNTMPHVLTPATSSYFDYAAVNWDARDAGDDITNPIPNFVGKNIQDIATFQDRLCFLSGDEVTMSETRNIWNFFRDTCTQLLSKHPINIRSTSKKTSKLYHFVEHNRDLLVTGGRVQFKISGEQPITPQTAAMPQTTAYNCSEIVSPISIGNSVYIPSAHGTYLNVSKYDGADRNLNPDSAHNITAHVRKYIPDTVRKMDGLPNHGLLFALDTSDNELYVCQYDTELTREEDNRFAWFKWNDLTNRDFTITGIATTKNKLSLAVSTTLGLQLLEFDMDAGADKRYLDYQKMFTSVNTTVTVGTDYGVDLSDIVVVQGAGCPDPGDYVDTVSLVAGVLTLDTDMAGGTVYVGYEFLMEAEPNLQVVRDQGDHVNSAANLRINKFLLSLVDTGYMEATEQSPYDTYDTQEFSGIISNSLDAITDTAVTTTDQFNIGFSQKADVGTVLLQSKSWLPLTIAQIEWFGTYTTRGRRF